MVRYQMRNEITFQREAISNSLFSEAMPLLKAHYEEIMGFRGIALDIDLEQYIAADRAGFIRCYSAREKGELIGYASYFVRYHPHFRQSLQALSDVLYISPGKRGFGRSFLQWCEEELRKEKVQELYQSVTVRYDFSKLLERMGYMRIDSTYIKRIN